MKARVLLNFSLLVLCSLFVISCPNPFMPPISGGTDLRQDVTYTVPDELAEQGYGLLSLSINEQAGLRTILPQNINWSSFTGRFQISITKTAPDPQPAVVEPLRTRAELPEPVYLLSGTYNITVIAFNGPDASSPVVARGSITGVIIDAGIAAAHNLIMSAIINDGTGTFHWNITIPAVNSAEMVITRADNNALVGAVETLTAGANTGSRTLNSGYYFVTTTLSRVNHADVVRRDVLHVYQNMESVFTVAFTDAYFNSTLHTVTFDYNHVVPDASIPVIHGAKLTRPPNPTRDDHVFMDWYTDAAFTALYNFNDDVLKPFTLYARWGTVSVSTNGGAAVNYADLSAAFTAIGATAGNHTVTVFGNQALGVRTMNAASQNITLVSSGTGAANERTIQFNGETNEQMFFLGNATARLTLGNNITLSGRNSSITNLAVVQSGTLTMLDGSKITGHTTTNGIGAVSVAAGASFVMSGGSITGNTSTVAIENSVGGLRSLSGASITISGGSITGNYAGGVPFDVHVFSDINLSGSAQIGVLRLNLQSANNSTVNLSAAFTGTVGTLHLRSDDTNMNTAIGHWTGNQVIQGISGYTLTAADIAKFPLGNFYSSTAGASQPISATHMIGTVAPDLGWLVERPVVTVTIGAITTNHASLDAALASISGAGNFTVTLYRDQMMTAGREISIAGQNITIVGAGGERIITHAITNAATTMFGVENGTASLTLGENITIQGRTAAGTGSVIYINNGANFTMQPGSRITGHTSNAVTGAAVQIGSGSINGTFIMNGGSIDGNNNTSDPTTTTASGGVVLMLGLFTMNGGSISGNTQGAGNPSDVYNTNISSTSFTMSGNAAIGALKLNAYNLTSAATVNIGAGWTGSIGTLNLRGDNDSIGTAVSYWTDRTAPIFNNINAAQVARIGLGEFIAFNNEWQAISLTHMIGTEGADLGRLVERPLNSIEAIQAYLAIATGGTTTDDPIDLPVEIALGTMSTGSGWQQLLGAIQTSDRYVALDLSACTMTGTVFDPVSSLATGKARIVEIILPDSALSIPDEADSAAFWSFTNLKSVSGKNVTSIGDFAFAGCGNLSSVSFLAATSIGDLAFVNCTSLASVSFPAVTSIGDHAFVSCDSLSIVSFPVVTSIGNGAFSDTGDIDLTITLGSAAPTLGSYMFDSVTTKTVTVQIPIGAEGYGYGISGTDTTTQSWANALRGRGWNGTNYLTGTVNTGVTVDIEAIP